MWWLKLVGYLKELKLMVFKCLAGSSIFLSSMSAGGAYDCTNPRPEMAGFHNMVLFGTPEDELYVYHLPLFKGAVNGEKGHVLMHVYQGLWNVSLDEKTKLAYDEKFNIEASDTNPIPFFSISPKGKKFKVPEMICNNEFSTDAVVAHGHIEGNPNFPPPKQLVNTVSTVAVKKETVFAQKFNGASKVELTYILFGTAKQQYLAHFLTDDENSFDQVLAVEVSKELLDLMLSEKKSILLSVPIDENSNLVGLGSAAQSKNNKFMLPVEPLGQSINVEFKEDLFQVKIKGAVYFNKDRDLQVL